MPRYFFDFHDGLSLQRDPIGTQCDGFKDVRFQAMRTLPQLACDLIPTDGDRQAFTVLVRDENDTTVYTATLTFAGLWIGDTPLPEPEEDYLG